MARLRDIPKVFAAVSPWEFSKRIWKEVDEDSVFVWAAALAYSWLFAVFPFLIFLLTLLPYLPPQVKAQAEGPLRDGIYQWVPQPSADLLWNNIYGVMHQTHNGILSIGILVTIWAASGGMSMTMAALDKVYDLSKPRPFYRQRPMAVLMTVVVATMVIAVLILLPIGTMVTHYVKQHDLLNVSRGLIWAWEIARYSLALLLLISVLAIVYYFGPNVRQRFRILTPGAAFTIAMWLVLGFGFRFYVDKFSHYDKTYGTVGGVAVLLLLFYIDAIVLLVGAEINSEMDFALGIPRGSTDFRNIPTLFPDPEAIEATPPDAAPVVET